MGKTHKNKKGNKKQNSIGSKSNLNFKSNFGFNHLEQKTRLKNWNYNPDSEHDN